MPYPPQYERLHSYTDHTIDNPAVPHSGQNLDQDFDEVAQALDVTQARLALIQREDGALAPNLIGPEQITAELEQALVNAAAAASGTQGPAGPVGDLGPAGVPGPQGAPLPWIVGFTVPSLNIGIAQQIFLNASNGDVYQKDTTGVWVSAGNIRGPEGPGGGGVSDHGQLMGLADPDHPIAAVQGLRNELDAILSSLAAAVSGQTRTYTQGTAPTGSQNAGDLWINTTQQNQLFRWDGAAWINVADSRITSAAAAAANAIAAASSAQATADGKVRTFFGSTVPAGPGVGDLWIRTDQSNALLRWSGSAWTSVVDTRLAEALAAANDAQATADGKIETFFQPSAPVGASVGDLWIDTDSSPVNHPYRFNGAQWVSIRDAGVAQALAQAATAITSAATAQAIADGKIDVFYQANAPTAGIGVGDLWIDTDDRQVYRYNGAVWESVRDSGIVGALNASSLAVATADGKITAFFQTTPPAGGQNPQTDDIWVDLDDANRPYRFNGAVWVDISPIIGVAAGRVTTPSIADNAVTTSKLAIISANGQTIDAQGGRMTWSNGAIMKVVGIGFGSANQFIEWFGPFFANLALCTEANAIAYLRVDGNAYFGGALSAGTLTTSAQTSSLAVNATVDTPVFGSNGGNIQVVLSYAFVSTVNFSGLPGAAPANGSGNNAATVTLQRSVAGGPFITVATLNATGTWSNSYTQNGGEHSLSGVSGCSGSITLTDSVGTTQTRQYRAVKAAAPHPVSNGNTDDIFGSASTTQSISIVCTE